MLSDVVTTQCTHWRFSKELWINVGQMLHVVLQGEARLEELSSASKVMFIGRKEIPFIASNIFCSSSILFSSGDALKHSHLLLSDAVTRPYKYFPCFFCIWFKFFSPKIQSTIFTVICSVPKMKASCSENSLESHDVFWASNEVVRKRGI